MNRFIKRVVKHIDKFPLSDRYNIEKIYGIAKEEYLQLLEYEKSLIDKTLLACILTIFVNVFSFSYYYF